MLRMVLSLALLPAALLPAVAQSEKLPERIQPGDPKPTMPTLIHKVEPQYSNQARDAGIQGRVLLAITVDERGVPIEIKVISPLGYGLDGTAVGAVSKWRFVPGKLEGKPVKVTATVQVDFRLFGRFFDARLELHRVTYNLALNGIRQGNREQQQASLERVIGLVKQEYPPAMHLLAEQLNSGELMPPDPDRARKLLIRAAAKDFGPAIYILGREYLDGEHGPHEVEKGRKMIDRAAGLGSVQAQYFLGSTYERANPEHGYVHNLERSEFYFRLCAAGGLSLCQTRLGKAILARDPVEAVAWLNLASAAGDPQADALLREELPKLTPEQARRVSVLKEQLVNRYN